MMASPRNIEPLLVDEKEPSLPRIGAYAPPGEASLRDAMSHPPPVPEPHDLHLTANDFPGHVHQHSMVRDNNDEDDLPPLPPLISYCSYVKFGCAFAKWHILVALVNLVVFSLCRKEGYFSYYSRIPFDSWTGSLVAGTWLGTAVWAYLCARRYDQDVQDYDRVAQYEQGQQAEDPENATMGIFIPNYEHMYGWVSRKIDASFTDPKSGGAQSLNSVSRPPPEGTSSLVNMSFVLWSISFAAAFSLAFGIIAGKGYTDLCDSKIPSNSTSPINKKDYNKLQSYPSGVQDWANAKPESYYDYRGASDDEYSPSGQEDEVFYDFPTAFSTQPGSFAELNDGTKFFAGLRPQVKQQGGKGYLRSDHMVLVESPGSGGSAIYHDEIRNPFMFIPVESTMTTNSRGDSIASQFCFTASEEKKEKQRSWDLKIRTTTIFCIISLNATSYEIRKELLAWTDKSRKVPVVRGASTGSEVLIAHAGNDDYHWYLEVVSISPAAKTQQRVFHMTVTEEGSRSDDDSIEGIMYDEYGRRRKPPTCIQKHVQVMSAIAGVVVLVMCSAWLIVREGVPAGVTPICFAAVLLIRMCTSAYSGINTMSLVFGTFFFHGILCCGNACPLPSWFGRELKVWGLYSWILAFLAVDMISGTYRIFLVALVLFGLSGIMLNHPTCRLIGYAMVAESVFIAIQAPFLRMFYGRDLSVAFSVLLLGMGVLGLENLLRSNRRYCAAFCRPMNQAGRTLFYGSRDGSGGNRPSSSS